MRDPSRYPPGILLVQTNLEAAPSAATCRSYGSARGTPMSATWPALQQLLGSTVSRRATQQRFAPRRAPTRLSRPSVPPAASLSPCGARTTRSTVGNETEIAERARKAIRSFDPFVSVVDIAVAPAVTDADADWFVEDGETDCCRSL